MPKKHKVLHPCICGCGELTGRLYHRGCDSVLQSALTADMVAGIPGANEVYIALRDKTVSDDEKRRIYADYRARQHVPDEWVVLAAD